MFGWRSKKLLSITAVFVVVWLVFCGLFTLTQIMNKPDPFDFNLFADKLGENALFFLGYGDSPTADVWLNNTVALIAILTISILTTFFTINFLWRVDDVVLMPAMFFEKTKDAQNNSAYKIRFMINNKGKRIANLRLSFTAYLHEENSQIKISESLEYTYPILFENSCWIIEDDLQLGFFQDVLYRQFSNHPDTVSFDKQNTKNKKVTIYMTLWFVDTQSGQECCNILDYNTSDLCAYDKEKNYKKMTYRKIQRLIKEQELNSNERKDFINYITIPFKPFDRERLKLSPRNSPFEFKIVESQQYASGAKIVINTENNNERFPMFYYDYKDKPLDWSIYEDDKINLVGKFHVDSDNINQLKLEVKSGDGSDHVYTFYDKTQSVNKENGTVCFNISLAELIKKSHNPNLKAIREINIVFPRTTNDKNGNLPHVSGSVVIEQFGLEYQDSSLNNEEPFESYLHINLPVKGSADEVYAMFVKEKKVKKWLAIDANIKHELDGCYELSLKDKSNKINKISGKITVADKGKVLGFKLHKYTLFSDLADNPSTQVYVIFDSSKSNSNATEIHLLHTGWGNSENCLEARTWFEVYWRNALERLQKLMNKD